MPRRSWIDARVDVFVAAADEYGLTIPRPQVADLLRGRLEAIANKTGLSPISARRYLDDDAVRQIVNNIVTEYGDEAPGEDTMLLDRTVELPLAVLGRCIAGLAHAIELRLIESDDLEHVQATATHVAQTIANLGLILTDSQLDEPEEAKANDIAVWMPPAILNRAARALQESAASVDAGTLPEGTNSAEALRLADAFKTDAMAIRQYSATET